MNLLKPELNSLTFCNTFDKLSATRRIRCKTLDNEKQFTLFIMCCQAEPVEAGVRTAHFL